MRQQLLDAIYGGQPFRTVLRDLGLTSNQVWGLAKTDQEFCQRHNGMQPRQILDLVLVLVFTIAAVEVNGGSDGQPMGFPAIQTE